MLKVKGNQVKYFRELPLHISQKEITRGINYSIFQYNLKVTFDLVQEILSYAPAVEVLAPKSLREEILKILLETCKLYDR
jgi:predicted DNA-binding transcriptional regulator YafY